LLIRIADDKASVQSVLKHIVIRIHQLV
jgi:hypothetical protein